MVGSAFVAVLAAGLAVVGAVAGLAFDAAVLGFAVLGWAGFAAGAAFLTTSLADGVAAAGSVAFGAGSFEVGTVGLSLVIKSCASR